MQKHRRKQRKMGLQDLCIGFSVYMVCQLQPLPSFSSSLSPSLSLSVTDILSLLSLSLPLPFSLFPSLSLSFLSLSLCFSLPLLSLSLYPSLPLSASIPYLPSLSPSPPRLPMMAVTSSPSSGSTTTTALGPQAPSLTPEKSTHALILTLVVTSSCRAPSSRARRGIFCCVFSLKALLRTG